ncbi:MAG: septum formation initiator family protein [Sphingobium sp.]|uniref:Septum formation initiator family protein n=1 Tax=Sphingobium terrigena TaxID=2304063 RepID=A0A418YW80_9SPHN|nr:MULTISPECIES: septum formation initiator family protein [Sphingobium]MBJ7444603.1 septum formation initiator family protein [Sphingobium sp.]MBV2147161.1 septum formation initiator family protein [Sphingobium sp. AS12]RJG56652.1 septum formation initiator family protein [Sphingobium terrigena]
MAHIAKLRSLLFSAFGPAVALLLLLVFAGYVVLGSNGVLAWGDYSRQLRAAKAELKTTKAAQAELRNRVEALDPRRVDPDLADELIRRQLGVIHHDEVIVPLN